MEYRARASLDFEVLYYISKVAFFNRICHACIFFKIHFQMDHEIRKCERVSHDLTTYCQDCQEYPVDY